MLPSVALRDTQRNMSLSNSPLKVLISGAGIAGPCLAYWLSRTHINTSITIVERSSIPRPTGQSIDVRGAAINVIKKMGLEKKVRACDTTEQGTRMIDTKGKAFAEFTKGDAFTAEYEILRADLCGLFLDATQTLENVKYTYGDYVTAITPRSSTTSPSTVNFSSGKQEDFDLIIAADGSTSKIRSMILTKEDLEGSYNFIGQYIAYFSIPSQPTDTPHWYWYTTTSGLALMTRPHRNPDTIGVYLCITLPARGQRDPVVEKAMDAGPEAQKRMLHAYFKDAGWEAQRILKGLDACKDFYMSRAAQVKLPVWHSSPHRTVLLGDAAHATFGVGTSLAIIGAYYLAGEISKISSSGDVPKALEKFEEVFRKIYAKSEDLPKGFPQIAFPQTRWGMRVRDAGLWLASKTKAYKLLPDDDSEKETKLGEYGWREM
jgi:2-polyprenyl-6-methoxyphenol hydroxylase-like FAD-dependent oxidoreductase